MKSNLKTDEAVWYSLKNHPPAVIFNTPGDEMPVAESYSSVGDIMVIPSACSLVGFWAGLRWLVLVCCERKILLDG